MVFLAAVALIIGCSSTEAPERVTCVPRSPAPVDSGSFGQADLNGLNVAPAAYSPGTMTDGNWKVALYIDEQVD